MSEQVLSNDIRNHINIVITATIGNEVLTISGHKVSSKEIADNVILMLEDELTGKAWGATQ